MGGIPELLADKDRVQPDDVAGLAAKLDEALANPAWLEHISRPVARVAAECRPELLNRRGATFLRKVRARAQKSRA